MKCRVNKTYFDFDELDNKVRITLAVDQEYEVGMDVISMAVMAITLSPAKDPEEIGLVAEGNRVFLMSYLDLKGFIAELLRGKISSTINSIKQHDILDRYAAWHLVEWAKQGV